MAENNPALGNPIPHDEEVVVIVGSGAGGGTVAYELTQQGIPCVVLEAGPWLLPEDYENDEWAAGHASEAVHVPLHQLSLDNVPAGEPLLVVCHVGGRSAEPTCPAAWRTPSSMAMNEWALAGDRRRPLRFTSLSLQPAATCPRTR